MPYYHHRKLKGGKKIRDSTVRSRTKEKVERRRET